MGGNPAGYADDQAAKIQACQLAVSGISGFVGGVIDHQTAVNHILELRLQSGQSLIVLHLQSLNGGVHLTEAHITD